MSIQTVITISSKYLLIIVSYIYIHNTNIHIMAFDNRIYRANLAYNVTFYTVTANKTYTVCRRSKYYKYKHGFFFAHALGGFKETKRFLPHPRVIVSIVGSLRDREVARSASDRLLCLEDSVISIISPSSGGSPGPV